VPLLLLLCRTIFPTWPVVAVLYVFGIVLYICVIVAAEMKKSGGGHLPAKINGHEIKKNSA